MIALTLRVLVIGFATYRIARLIAQDSITEPMRFWVSQRGFNGVPRDLVGEMYAATVKSRPWAWAYGLVSCAFCCGVWVGLALYALWTTGEWARTGIAATAAVGVQAVLAASER